MATTTYNVFAQVQEGDISVAAGGGYTIQECSLAAYNALATKAASTLYVITSTGEEEGE